MILLIDYINWQFSWGPRWILRTSWSGVKALTKMFSVSFMLRTLLAAWHKDTMSWHGGTLSQYGLVIGWNIISRLIGLLIRSAVIIIWASSLAIFLLFVLLSFLIFILWPLLVVAAFSTGLALTVSG